MCHSYSPNWVIFEAEVRGCRPRQMRGGNRGWGGGRRGWPRVRRGDVRAAALLLLEEEPRNGYQLMQELEQRSGGVWRPSPGAMYPALAQLEDEGLIRATDPDAKKRYELTDEGKAYVEEHRQELGTPWETVGEDVPEGLGDLRHSLPQLAMALQQIMRGGNPEQIAEAKRILDDARKALYRVLAGD